MGVWLYCEETILKSLSESKPHVYAKVQKHGMRIVRLEYDYLCNFHCQHCDITPYRGKSDRRALTVDDVKDLAKQADELGFAQFVITGGEPIIYPDFDKIVEAIDPQKFYITIDTNGWEFDWPKAVNIKKMGVDKVQISIDSYWPSVHDKFRNKADSFARAIQAVEYSKLLGFNVIVQTVIDKQRVMSSELVDFIEYFNNMDVPVCILYAKPVGGWKDKKDVMLDQSEIDYVEALCRKYNCFSHLTPTGECIACKRMINITKWGDVNPCPVMQEYSMGNIFNEPLAEIMKRMEKKFSGHIPVCIMAQEEDWRGYVENL